MSALAVRNWVDDPQAVTADWLDWVRERIASGEWSMLIDFRYATLARGFWARGDWRASVQLSQAIWELLGQAEPKIAKEQRDFWDCRRFDALGAIEAEDWAAAEEIIRREIEELGTEAGDWQLTIIATIRGLPTPPEVVQAVKQKSIDRYRLNDWYVVAREAAAAGDEAKAFDALHKALSYWTNPPHSYTDQWENDAYWDDLRNHPEFKAAFDEKRRRIGPVYGQLHYFPGW